MSGSMPSLVSRRLPPAIATAMRAMAGCERCVMKRPSADVTIIQRRSHSGPVSVTRKASTSMPRQDFTG